MSRVAYQPDIAAALDAARWEAFRNGDFYRTDDLPQALTMTEEEFAEWLVDDSGPLAEPEARPLWRAVRAGEPRDPDTLRFIQPESGTHSVIDMESVSDVPDMFAVAPAPGELLDSLFGTRTPSTDAVAEVAATGGLDLRDRWYGTYVIGYRDTTPEAIFFVGHSGD
ncbi:hypothetical protein [Actinoplanes sp. NPDC020271]|uniref:hypothetical protein n=1 Tax=Actinoplanes sp. NPDC020271 TaxID=3363896 RepID=UPI0037B3F8B7